MSRRSRIPKFGVGAALLSLALSAPAQSQPQDTGGACIPASERAGRLFGCFIVAAQPVGQLERAAAFWHVETFPNRAAGEKAKSARGTLLEAFGQVWLLTIAEAGWRSPGGLHVAEIGPLPTTPGSAYTAQFMEAVFRPGMKSLVHRHSGPEAWYTVSGETCLETPQGTMIGRAGGSQVIVPGGPPMELTATGSEVRRALVLILHDSAQPPTSPVSDWTPRGLCKA
jgi:quercetin dioxygenase-like cupin family protein